VSSQLDLDQGGTIRQTHKVYLGPSVGWVEASWEWVLNVTAGGTTTVALGNNLILVNFNGTVTIQLPSLKASAAGVQAIPRQFLILPITISDIGGFAAPGTPINILPFGSELISGTFNNTTTILKLTSAYGAIVIRPDIINGGGTLLQ
jgi:hypothetical protein